MKHLFLSAVALAAFAAPAQEEAQQDPEIAAPIYEEDSFDQEQAYDFEQDEAQIYEAQCGPGWGCPSPGRNWTCFARNNRGQVFSARSWDRTQARRTAMSRCARTSTACFFRNCR